MSSLHNALLFCLLPTSSPLSGPFSPASAHYERPARQRTAIFATIAKAAMRALTAVVRWRQREAIRQELMGMDDHLLADIGVRRDEIPFLFSKRLRLHTPNPVRPWSVATKTTGVATSAREETDSRPMAA